jgi:hypothetical protein
MARTTRTQRQILICAAFCGVLVLAGGVAVAPKAATAAGRNAGALLQTIDDPGRALNPWHSTQLHIHSWSNHNAGSQPGSMQYHTAWAQAKGLDVIWWTDHNKLFVQEMDLPLYLQGAAITDTLDIAVPHPPGIDPWFRAWQIGWLDASVTGAGMPAVALNNGVLRMELHHAGSQFSGFSYRALDYQQRRIGGQSFVRPLVSDPVLNLDVSRCDAGGADAYAEIRFGLSWHTANGVSTPQELVYRLTPAGEPPAVVASSQVVTFSLPVSTGHIERSLLADARLLPHGDDNAIQELTFKIGSRNNAPACLEISNFLISSTQRDPAANFAAQRPIAQRLEVAYGVVQHVGWEQNAGDWHLNPYLPRQAALTPGWQDISAPAFIPAVHAQGGLAALNHPFGAGYLPLLPAGQQDALVQNRFNRLLPVRAWGADLLEIYLDRAGVDLAHHLKLWDLLAANGVPMCGIATSDQHGGPLTSPRTHMVTWINAPNSSQNALLAGLAGCRAFFGRIDLFDGVIDLHLGPIVMGGAHPTASGIGLLHVSVDPLPPGAQVRLVQVADQPGSQLNYIVDHAPIDPSQPVAIDISRPGFVRVELWSVDGVPIAFSNRIYLKAVQCDVNQSAGVDIVDVQLVAGAFNQTVPPAPVAYDLLRDNRIDVRDVTLAAQCWAARR